MCNRWLSATALVATAVMLAAPDVAAFDTPPPTTTAPITAGVASPGLALEAELSRLEPASMTCEAIRGTLDRIDATGYRSRAETTARVRRTDIFRVENALSAELFHRCIGEEVRDSGPSWAFGNAFR